VVGGTSRLVEALGAALGEQIQLRHVLTRVEQRGQTYTLSFQGRPAIEADHVILAMPFAVLRGVELDVKLPSKLRRMIRELDSGRNEKLLVGFAAKTWRQQSGFVQEAWADGDLTVAWDATQRQAERSDGALTLFVGGA
jgi:monoamine oxidase